MMNGDETVSLTCASGVWEMSRRDLAILAMNEFWALRERYHLSPEGDWVMYALAKFGDDCGVDYREAYVRRDEKLTHPSEYQPAVDESEVWEIFG